MRRWAATIAAITIVIIVVTALFPYFDPRVPFRFERFEGLGGLIGVGEPNVAAANAEFLNHFPLGTPLGQIENYFSMIGGHCGTLPKDRPGHLICDYGHRKYPLNFCAAQMWNADIEYNEQDNRAKNITIRPWVDGC